MDDFECQARNLGVYFLENEKNQKDFWADKRHH